MEEYIMWLLKVHFSISILCLLTFIGFRKVFNDLIKQNGYLNENTKRSNILAYFIFFTPILNVLSLIVLFIMISTKKSDLDKKIEELKNESDNLKN